MNKDDQTPVKEDNSLLTKIIIGAVVFIVMGILIGGCTAVITVFRYLGRMFD